MRKIVLLLTSFVLLTMTVNVESAGSSGIDFLERLIYWEDWIYQTTKNLPEEQLSEIKLPLLRTLYYLEESKNLFSKILMHRECSVYLSENFSETDKEYMDEVLKESVKNINLFVETFSLTGWSFSELKQLIESLPVETKNSP